VDREIEEIIKIAGISLQEEDYYLTKSVNENSQYCDDNYKGILRFNNERFYQYVVARSFLKRFPARIDLEKDTHDLVVYGSVLHKYKIVVEMKRWMSSGGGTEIPGIKHDSSVKLAKSDSDKAMMMVFSSNPKKSSLTEENIQILKNEITSVCDVVSWSTYKFITNYRSKGDNEFWIAGFEISKA
jgi:hypothetical protein